MSQESLDADEILHREGHPCKQKTVESAVLLRIFRWRVKSVPESHHDMCNPNSKRRIGKPGCRLLITGPVAVSTFVPIHVEFWGLPRFVRLNTLKLSTRSWSAVLSRFRGVERSNSF